jgi:parvulin-like peptidyl-prolyl isomerase
MRFFYYFTALLIISFCTNLYAEIPNTKSIGTLVDESYIYKLKKPKKAGDKEDETLAILKSIDNKNKKKAKTENSAKGIKNTESFVVGRVNKEVITNLDILNAIRFVFFSAGKTFDKNSAKLMLKPIINVMVDEIFQQQYAKSLNIDVTDSEIEGKVTEIASSNGLSVNELAKTLEEYGISMDVFRQNIRKKILLQSIAEIFAEDIKITKGELQREKKKIESELKSKRYYLSEIFFRVDKKENEQNIKRNAELVLELIKNGFSFQLMAETLSQRDYSKSSGNKGWYREESLETPIRVAVKQLNPGECSSVIETKTGYKIVCLLDIADPGKVGRTQGTYKVLRSAVKYRSELFSSEEAKNVGESLTALIKSSSETEYKNICQKYGISFEEKKITKPNDYDLELITRSESAKSATALQSLEDEDIVNILLVIGKEFESAKIPEDKILIEKLSFEKFRKEFLTNFNKLKTLTHIEINNENLQKVLD